jgi:hypothetical protein
MTQLLEKYKAYLPADTDTYSSPVVINSFQNKIITIQHANQSIIILTQCALHQLVHMLTGCNFMYFKKNSWMFYFDKWNKNPTEWTMDNFISHKINVVYHRNCYRKYTSKQNCTVFKTDQINFYNYWTSFNYALTYNALLPVQRFFSPFLDKKEKVSKDYRTMPSYGIWTCLFG